ncbi:MAG: hypothetical protein EOO88_27330 [Pedobacter sp.]|nr:MAG: hypothetical protein EOO88_27330 [Pedobacter sp.]
MKKIFLIVTILILQLSAIAQDKLVKDIDFDGKPDTVYIDQNEWKIVCRLSTQNFKKLKSKPIETSGDNTYIKSKKNGFEMSVNWMRAGRAKNGR